jgi:hypothetical protein
VLYSIDRSKLEYTRTLFCYNNNTHIVEYRLNGVLVYCLNCQGASQLLLKVSVPRPWKDLETSIMCTEILTTVPTVIAITYTVNYIEHRKDSQTRIQIGTHGFPFRWKQAGF